MFSRSVERSDSQTGMIFIAYKEPEKQYNGDITGANRIKGLIDIRSIEKTPEEGRDAAAFKADSALNNTDIRKQVL